MMRTTTTGDGGKGDEKCGEKISFLHEDGDMSVVWKIREKSSIFDSAAKFS